MDNISSKILGCLAILQLLFLTGCVTAPNINFDSVKTDLNKGQTYTTSTGIQKASQKQTDNSKKISLKSGKRECVTWGGVVLAGSKDFPIMDFHDLENHEKCLAGDHEKCSVAVLNRRLIEVLQASRPAGFDIDTGGKGDDKESAPVQMFLALSSEYLRTRPDPLIEGNLRVELEIQGQLLFLDPKADMQVVGSYPLGTTVIDSISGKPSVEKLRELALDAFVKPKESPEAPALSLADQVTDLLGKYAINARGLRAPLAVAPFAIESTSLAAVSPEGLTRLEQKQVADWPDFFGNALSNRLAINSGFPVNPYTSSEQQAQFLNNKTLNAAWQLSFRTPSNSNRTAKLQRPAHRIQVTLKKLYVVFDQDRSAKYIRTFNYGFDLDVSLLQVDTGEKLVDKVSVSVPGKRGKFMTEEMVEKYSKLSRVKMRHVDLENHKIDHLAMWRGSIDRYLLQLANEIAYPEEDAKSRFQKFRDELKRNF